jgi:hypothetical protein
VGNSAFKVPYARTVDGIVFILFCEDGRYLTVHTERDEERWYSASDMTPWSPQNGERVVEEGSENSPIGIVVEAGEEESSVVWTGLRRQVSWFNSYLEPVWID